MTNADGSTERPTVRVYRGAPTPSIHDGMFVSSCADFASDYGEVEAYDLILANVIDTTDPKTASSLLPLYDPYDGVEIATIEAYLARSNDTWEMIEDIVARLPANGVVIVTEGGVVNYLVRDCTLVTRVETDLSASPSPGTATNQISKTPDRKSR